MRVLSLPLPLGSTASTNIKLYTPSPAPTPSALLALPAELVHAILLHLPTLGAVSHTCRHLRRTCTSRTVQRAWARRFMRMYNDDWECVVGDTGVWDETEDESRGAGRAGKGARGSSLRAVPGLLQACVEVCEVTGDKVRARVLVAACGWDAVGVVEAAIAHDWFSTGKEIETEPEHDDDPTSGHHPPPASPFPLSAVLTQGLERALRSPSPHVVAYLASHGYALTACSTHVAHWVRELTGAIADWRARGCDPREGRRRALLVRVFLTAVRREDVRAVAARVLAACVGDEAAMRVCLDWNEGEGEGANVYASATTYLRTLLTRTTPHLPHTDIRSALALCEILTTTTATTLHLPPILLTHTFPVPTILHLLHHALAPPAHTNTTPLIHALLALLPPRDTLLVHIKDVLELVLLTARTDILEWVTRSRGVELGGVNVAGLLLTAVLHTRPQPTTSTTTTPPTPHIATVRTGLALLAAAGAAVERDGHTALIYAARFGDAWAVTWLLGQGVNVQANRRTGAMALMHAIEAQAQDVVRVLREAGAVEG
ncbi:hypothetical protein DFJ77DRAFT_443765 [Powellomyces hirtus]|nr:hypothetical protein DFJ77DRAFT_443765 [Powellomyces hirtus]